ncbi:MAG: thrombospondin type 3 repeat-containing protein [Flavobacteriaceae bacterium]
MDCDGDGVTNGQEIIDGTDPLDECSLNVASQTLPPSTAGTISGTVMATG